MKKTKYFTATELCRSKTAKTKGIDNTPDREAELRLIALIEQLLDPVRARWGAPITVNSGYRSLALNKAVGGVDSSQHTKGEAADITAGSPEKNKQLFELIQNSGLAFDQLIDERDYQWIHLSYSNNNRNIILHI